MLFVVLVQSLHSVCGTLHDCLLPEAVVSDLKQIDFLYLPTDELILQIGPYEGMLLSACPASAALATLIHASAEIRGRSFNEIPEIFHLSEVHFPSVDVFYSTHSLFDIFVNYLGYPILSASRKLSTTLRHVIGLRPDVAYNCALAHRHVSSTRTLVDKYPGELEMTNRLIPFGERLRDLGISRKLCGVETATTIAALTRSFVQIIGGHMQCDGQVLEASDFRPLLDLIDSYKAGENHLRLHATVSPLYDALQSLNKLFVVPKNKLMPLSLIKPKLISEGGHIFGFACDEITCSSLDEADWENSAKKDTCEISQVVSAFINLEDVRKVDSLRRPWLFLQSINASWHEKLRDRSWGLKLTQALEQLAARGRESGMKPRRNPKHCRDKQTTEFLLWVEEIYLPTEEGTIEFISGAFAQALRGIADVNPDCSAALAVAYLTALDVITTVISRPACYGQTSLLAEVAKEDLATVTEIVWQTVAGEKLSDLIAYPGGLFKLMRRFWQRLVYHSFVF